jgi:hypothetical protein
LGLDLELQPALNLTAANFTHDRFYRQGRKRGASFLAGPYPKWQAASVRGLAKQIGWPAEKLIAKATAFDRERLDSVPSLTRYPELRDHPDRIVSEDRGMRDAGLTQETIALHRSLDFYTRTRLYEEIGRAVYVEVGMEECRILYVPDSEIGPIHAKNVDGPLPGNGTPQPPVPRGTPWFWNHPIVLDGVGSGLHIDEIPPEIFPVNMYDLCYENCTTFSEATNLLTNYNVFWGGGNLLVHDYKGNSVAFEKTQCRIGTRGPNRNGVTFTSGMGALDPDIREHQQRMRQKYLDQVGDDWNGPEGCFWRMSDETYKNMERYVEQLPARPTLDQVNGLMERRDPDGPLCYTGEQSHPRQPAGCWSVEMRLFIINERKCIRRQVRDGKPACLDTPEVIEYGPPIA